MIIVAAFEEEEQGGNGFNADGVGLQIMVDGWRFDDCSQECDGC